MKRIILLACCVALPLLPLHAFAANAAITTESNLTGIVISKRITIPPPVPPSGDGVLLGTPTASTPSITVLSPNGGESIVKGQSFSITWSVSPDLGDTLISAYIDVSGGFCKVGSASGFKGILQATLQDTGDCFVATGSHKIVLYAGPLGGSGANDKSDNYFTVTAPVPSITVHSPKDGEVWQVGSTNTISWSSLGLDATDRVCVVLMKLENRPLSAVSSFWAFSEIARDLPTVGSYSWTIPQRLNVIPAMFREVEYTPGAQYKILIGRSLATGSLDPFGESEPFSITEPLSLKNVRIWSPQGNGEMMMTFEMGGAELGQLYQLESRVNMEPWRFEDLFLAKGYNPGPQEMTWLPLNPEGQIRVFRLARFR